MKGAKAIIKCNMQNCIPFKKKSSLILFNEIFFHFLEFYLVIHEVRIV
jgi:hypothetical protein